MTGKFVLNRYSLWKYIAIVLVLLLGLLYALPNLYGEDLVIKVSSIRDKAIGKVTLSKIHDLFQRNNIDSKSLLLEKNKIVVHFKSHYAQSYAQECLKNFLGEDYIISLSLEPATPHWLTKIGAKPMKLGLDLQGGVHFLIEINVDTVLSKFQDEITDSLRNFLVKKGIVYRTLRKLEPNSSEIHFFSPNVRSQAKSLLRKMQNDVTINEVKDNGLQFRLTNESINRVREYSIKKNIAVLRNRISQLGISEPLVQRQGLCRIIVELPGIQDATYAKKYLEDATTVEFHLANELSQQNGVSSALRAEQYLRVTGKNYPLEVCKKTILTGDHIIDAFFSLDEFNRPQVNVYLDDIGAASVSNATKKNIGKLIATFLVHYKINNAKNMNSYSLLDKTEEIINIATIKSELNNSFRITGLNEYSEAKKLALLFRAGTLVAPIQLVEERIIGPTLGIKNIVQGAEACLGALIASVFFVFFYYRKFGLIIIAALIANLVLLVGAISVLPNTVLTMPGIAGVVLTLVVAIDANVLTNERIKEELRNGRTVQKAIHEGYRKAFSSIFDANATMMIIAIILYIVGTGPVKSFSIITIIGISTSLLTAIVGTRAIVNLVYGRKQVSNLPI